VGARSPLSLNVPLSRALRHLTEWGDLWSIALLSAGLVHGAIERQWQAG